MATLINDPSAARDGATPRTIILYLAVDADLNYQGKIGFDVRPINVGGYGQITPTGQK
jgi:hypothetical protein